MSHTENNKEIYYNQKQSIFHETENKTIILIVCGVIASLISGILLGKLLYDPYNMFFHIIYHIYAGLIIGFAISIGITISFFITREKYNNKKILFNLILICSFFTYLIFTIETIHLSIHNPFLNSIKSIISYRIWIFPLYEGFWLDNSNFLNKIAFTFQFITFGQVSSEKLKVIVIITSIVATCILEFFLIIFSALFFIYCYQYLLFSDKYKIKQFLKKCFVKIT